MAKKIVKRKKIKLFNWLLFLFFIGIVVLIVYFASTIPIQYIIIKNTNYLNDDLILEISELKNYPEYLKTSSAKTVKKLKKSPYISDAKLIKKLDFGVVIEVSENEVLFLNNNNQKYVFKNGEDVEIDEVSTNFRVPRLLNYVPDNKYRKFVTSMGRINGDILSKISDIEYQPNDYDKDRFLLYMDDGNMVFLTLTKFKMINHYNEVLKQLENHKGILYLDNGNHFQIRE